MILKFCPIVAYGIFWLRKVWLGLQSDCLFGSQLLVFVKKQLNELSDTEKLITFARKQKTNYESIWKVILAFVLFANVLFADNGFGWTFGTAPDCFR